MDNTAEVRTRFDSKGKYQSIIGTVTMASPDPVAVTVTFWLMSLIWGNWITGTRFSRWERRSVRGDSLCFHLGCSGGVVVFLVQLVLVRTGSARQQNVHVKIVLWLFSTGPVFSYCLVDYYGSLEIGGINTEKTVTLKRSSVYGRKREKWKIFRSYLSWSVTTAHLLLFVQPPDNWSGIFKRLYQQMHNVKPSDTQDYILTK